MNLSEKNFFMLNLFLLVFFSALFLLAVIFDVIPMGIPGQWVFPHIEKGKFTFPSIEMFAGIIFATLILFTIFWRSSDHEESAKFVKTRFILALVLCSFFDVTVLLAGRIGFSENIYAIYDRYASGYLESAYDIKSIKEFMSEFHEKQGNQKFINHINVHPPGRTLLSYAVKSIIETFPALEKFIIRTMPTDAKEAFACIEKYELFPFFKMDDKTKATGLLLLYFFFLIITIGKALIACIIWKLYDRESALFCAAFYLFAPPSILFFGHYDCIMTAQSALLILIAVFAAKNESRIYPFLAGLYAGLSSLFSLAFGVPCLWVLLYWFLLMKKQNLLNKFIYNYLGPFAVGFFIVIILLQVIFDFPFFHVLLGCLKNNEQFFMYQSTRTWVWKFLNYIEFLIAAGIPLMIFLFSFVIFKFREVLECFFDEKHFSIQPVLISSACIIIFLGFTPTRAEVSRQWSSAYPILYLIFPQFFNAIKPYRKIMLITCAIFLILQIFIFRFFIKLVIIE